MDSSEYADIYRHDAQRYQQLIAREDYQGSILPAGLRFRRELDARFLRVRRSGVVWPNLPPAFVYRCHGVR